MRITNDGLSLLSPSDYSVSQLLLETDGSDLEQYMDTIMDDTFAMSDSRIFQELLNDIIYAPVQMEQFSAAQALQTKTVDDFPEPLVQFSQAMAMPSNEMSCEEIMKLAGAELLRASADCSAFDHATQFAIPALPREENDGLQLAHLLLSSRRNDRQPTIRPIRPATERN
ncbi:hypothetical protein KI387_020913, partial [Taxus chinensis]